MGKDLIKRDAQVTALFELASPSELGRLLSLGESAARPCANINVSNFPREYRIMASANDMKAAEKTYEGFINMVKWSTPVIAAIVALVVILIAS